MIQLELNGGAEAIARVRRLNERIQPEMARAMERLTVKLQTMVKADKLSGQVLKVRTGRLRNSIARDVQSEGSTVTGLVSSAIKYAAAHEYGFQGSVSVREHMWTIRQAFGRPIEEKEISVRAHSMRMNLPERSFLRSALAEMADAGTIRAEMEAAVERAAQ